MKNCYQRQLLNNSQLGFWKIDIRNNEQVIKTFLAYADEQRKINLIRYAGKFLAINIVEGEEPQEITLNLPKYFESIPDEKISIALNKHGKHLVRRDEKVISLNIYPLLLGGGQVSSKVLSSQPIQIKDGSTDTRLEELQHQISDVNLVLDEWRRKYKELEQSHRTTKIEKIVEVPVEVVKFVEVPKLVDKSADGKISELQGQIENYEKRINDWRSKFYKMNETFLKESSMLSTENTFEHQRVEIPEQPKELIIQDKEDNEKLRVIKEKIRSLHQFSRDLQKKCVSIESRITEQRKEVPVEVISYVDKPVESIRYDNQIVENLKKKVTKLNETLKEWQDKYSEYETGLYDLKFETGRMERNLIQEATTAAQFIEEQDDESVVQLKGELESLKETLKDWQTRLLLQEEVVVRTVNVPVEVVKYVERPVEIVKYDETKSNELQYQINEIYGTIEAWKKKYQNVKKSAPLQRPRYKFNPVKVAHKNEEIEDERVAELNKKVESVKNSLTYWESLYREVSSKTQNIINNETKIEKPITRYVEKPVTVYINDDTKVNELRAKITEMYKQLEVMNSKPIVTIKKEPIVINREIVIPIERVKKVQRKITKRVYDEERIKQLTETLNDLQESLFEWESKCNELQQKEIEIIIKTEEVPVEVIKYIEKPVYVTTVHEERLNQIVHDYEELQKTINFFTEKLNNLSKRDVKVIEKVVEVPVEVVQYIDVPVEVPVVDEIKLAELTEQYRQMQIELEQVRLRVTQVKSRNKIFIDKVVENPVDVIEYIEIENEVVEVDHLRINELNEEIDRLTKTLDQLKWKYELLESREVKIIEKVVEVPIEVIEYVEKEVEIKTGDMEKIKELQDEHDRLTREISIVKTKYEEIEKTEVRVVTREVEIPIEKIEYVDKIVDVVKVDEVRLRLLRKEYEELSVSLNNWKAKFEAAQQKQQKTIQRVVENPIEVIEVIENEKIVNKFDEKRMRDLSREYDRLTGSIEILKDQCLRLQQRQPKIVYKQVEVPIENIQYFDEKKEVLIVDEELLKSLNIEIDILTRKHEELVHQCVVLENTSVRVIDRHVEVAQEVEKWVEYDVETVEIDEKRIRELILEIENLNHSIRACQEKYNLKQSREVVIIPEIHEVPVEVIEYEDQEVEVHTHDEEAVNHLKNLYLELTKEIQSIQEEIRTVENDEGIVVEKIRKKANKIVQKADREVEIRKVDQTKVDFLRKELDTLNEKLLRCNEDLRDLQIVKTRVVEKRVEVPFEKEIIVDVEKVIKKVDFERIDMLQKRIIDLEIQIRDAKPSNSLKKRKRQEIVEKYVDQVFETVKYIDNEVEVVKLDHDKFDGVVVEYNRLVDELKDWKVRYLELENQNPRIVETRVKVPLEKIVYVDVPVVVMVEDKERIERMTKEYESLSASLEFWKSKTEEIEVVSKRVIEKYIDVPIEKTEFVDREIVVVRVDEDKIKILTQEYERLIHELNRVKQEYLVIKRSEAIIVDKLVEVPKEVIEEVEKIVEIKVVDQAKLDALTKEYNEMVERVVSVDVTTEEVEDLEVIYQDKYVEKVVEEIQYEDVYEEEIKEDLETIKELVEQYNRYTTHSDEFVRRIQKYVKLPPKVVEVRKEIPYEILKYNDREITVVKRDEVRERELIIQIEEIKDKIQVIQEQCDRIEKTPPQVVKKVVEIPVEVIKYVEHVVEVVKFDNDRLDVIQNGIVSFRTDLIGCLEKYEDLEEPEDIKIQIKAEIPLPVVAKRYDEPYYRHDDDTKLRDVQNQMLELNNILIELAARFRKVEQTQQRVVEVPVEVPIEVIRYVDKPYEVYVNDDSRIKDLQNEISILQKTLESHSQTSLSKEDHIKEFHQIVKVKQGHIPREKETFEVHDNVDLVGDQIELMIKQTEQWKAKYRELTKRERKVIERIVEVPVEVIKYVDKRREYVSKDDQRIQNLERELITLSTQFSEWQTIFSEQSETSVSTTTTRSKKSEVFGELPSTVKTDEQYLEISSKIANFANEFNYFKKNVQRLENMEKIIIGKVIEVPREVAEIIEYHIESEDNRPKQYLRQLETLNSKLDVWRRNIQSKIQTITPKRTEIKLDYQEQYVDNTPILVRDTKFEQELENELFEITRLVEEYQQKSCLVEYQKQELIENFTQVVKDVERVIYEDVEEIIKDTTHEVSLEKLIKDTTNTINERKSEYRTKRNRNIEYLEKVVKIKREIIKNVIRNLEIPKYDESQIRSIEFKYDQLSNQLEKLIEKYNDCDYSEFDVIEKEVIVERQVLKAVPREVGVEIFDERPILEMVDKLNRLNKVLIETRNESSVAESGEVEIVHNVIKKDKEVVRYEIIYKDVFVVDENQIRDLEERRNIILKRVNKWQEKVAELETHKEVIVEKIIEIPVKSVKTYYRSLGRVIQQENNIKELAGSINNLNYDLITLQSEYDLLCQEKNRVEEKIVEVPKIITRIIENVIEKVTWDDTEIREYERRIKDATKQITLLEDKTLISESLRREAVEKVVKVDKKIKKYVIKDIEKIIVNDEACRDLESDIATLNETLNVWRLKLEELKNLQVPIIEKVIEVEREKITKIKRVIEIFKNDDKPIQKALDIIAILNRKVEECYRKIDVLERRSIKTVEKIVHVPKDVYIYRVKRTNINSLDETNVMELEERKLKLIAELSEWQRKVAAVEIEQIKVVKKVIEVPKKILKKIKRDIEIHVFDDSELREWEDKCSEIRKEIHTQTKRKQEVLKDKKKIIERIKDVTFDIVTYQDNRREKIVWDDELIVSLQSQVEIVKKQLEEAEIKKKETEVVVNTVFEQVVEVHVEKIKKIERFVDKIVWDDTEIHRLENQILALVNKINIGAHAPEQVVDEEIEYIEKIVYVPREIVIYKENIKQRFVYDDSPIEEINTQIDMIKNEIRDYRFKVGELSKMRERIIEKVIEEPYEVIKEVENRVEIVKFDEQKALDLQKKIEIAMKQQDKFRNAYKLKKNIREEVIEKEIRVEREVVKKVERLNEKIVWDSTRVDELEGKINKVKNDVETIRNDIIALGIQEVKIVERVIEVPKEIKIYKEKIVQKYTEEFGPIIEIENRIKSIKHQEKVDIKVVKTVEKKRKEVRDNIIELVRVEVKKINRPIKVIKFDDTRVKELQIKVDEAKKNYKPIDHDVIEVIQAEADIVEKIIEVPVKIIKEIDRSIERIVWDHDKISAYEIELENLRKIPDTLYIRMERLIEERNKVVVEEQVVNVEIVKYLPKLVEKVVYKKGITEQLEVELNGLRNNLKVIIEQYNNLKNIEKEYIYKAIEIPYETVKYVERPIEVFKIDQEKVNNLERELERLRAVEIEIKAKIDEVQIQKNTTIKRRKNVLTEKIKTIERPIKTLRVSNDKMVDLEKQLNDAQIELTNWQKRCEQYDIIKEKIIEVPHEVIKEVEYPVEVVKADDELVKNLAMSLSSIKAAMTGIEIKHELLSEQQNEVIERIVEKPKKIEREVEREINVVKFDSEKVNFLNEQIKGLKSNLSQRRKEFNNYERNRNITEERSFYEEEVIRLIQRPVELLTLDKKAQREIQRQFDKAYGLLEQWRIRYRELLDEKYTPEEKYIEVPVEKKKFAVSKVEIMKPDENDIKRLEIEIEKMNTDILSFQSKISEVQTSLKHTIINEKIIEVAKETVIEVEKPTHFYTMDNESVRELRNELKTLRTTVTSTINRRY